MLSQTELRTEVCNRRWVGHLGGSRESLQISGLGPFGPAVHFFKTTGPLSSSCRIEVGAFVARLFLAKRQCACYWECLATASSYGRQISPRSFSFTTRPSSVNSKYSCEMESCRGQVGRDEPFGSPDLAKFVQ